MDDVTMIGRSAHWAGGKQCGEQQQDRGKRGKHWIDINIMQSVTRQSAGQQLQQLQRQSAGQHGWEHVFVKCSMAYPMRSSCTKHIR